MSAMRSARDGDGEAAFDVAGYAAEISRLETLMGTASDSTRQLLLPGEEPLLDREILRGPLSGLLKEADGDPRRALLLAKARVAAHRTRAEVEGERLAPPWLRFSLKVLIVPLLLGILIPSIVKLLTARQELALFREQKSYEAMRTQGERLLGQLAKLAIQARELRRDVDYYETGTEG